MNSLVRNVVIVVAFLGAFAGVRYLIGAVVTNEQVRQVTQRADDPKSEPVVSHADAKREFMNGCDDGSLNGEGFNQTMYCGCVWDKAVAVHGVNYLIRAGLNDTDEQIQALLQPYTTRCLSEQGVEV